MANRRIKKKKMLMEQKASQTVTVNPQQPVKEAPSINNAPAVEAVASVEEIKNETVDEKTVVEEVKSETAKVNVAPKTEKAKAAAAKKTAAKAETKTAEPKTAAKSRSLKTRFVIQHQGHEFEERDIVAKIKQKWKEDGNMVKDLKDLDIYIKPEDCKVYYTINGDIAGNFAFDAL